MYMMDKSYKETISDNFLGDVINKEEGAYLVAQRGEKNVLRRERSAFVQILSMLVDG